MPVQAVFIGFGARGQIYADYALAHPKELTVTAVAEPRAHLRRLAAEKYGCPGERIYPDWKSLLAAGVCGDAAFIATQDNEHIEPALAAVKAGYSHLMLEKPIDRDPKKCVHLMHTANAYGASVQVCHTLRYMPVFRSLKERIGDGVLGGLIHLSLFEGYGFFPFAHSYVRGDWSVSEDSSPLLLAKCCHDADIIYYLTGKRWRETSSFGRLTHFNADNAPKDGAQRCIDCPHRASCIFTAENYGTVYRDTPLYRNAVEKEGFGSLQEALREGRYGRCVYRCGNTAPDHQTVNVLLDGGITANLTVSGFSAAGRRLHVMGTRGELFCDVEAGTLRVNRFGERSTLITVPYTNEHHGGADRILVEEFIAAVRGGPPVTDIAQAIESHTLCDAAERARLENRVVSSEPFPCSVLQAGGQKEPA